MQEEIQKKLVSQVDEIEKKLLKVDEDIKEINKNIENNTKRINMLELKLQLNSISIDFTFLLTQFQTEQKTLFQVIKNANRGDLDPYVLTPLNLVEMLEDIQPNLPEETKFPFYPNIENAHKLYNIIKPSVYLYNSKIIFILQIPLVNSKTFTLHKITSLPIPVRKNVFIFILPQEAYLMIDNNYYEYMLMSSNNFNDYCEEISKSKFLCKQVQQISFVHSSTECELTIFKSTKELPDSCNKRIMLLDKPIFLQLQQPKTWIYAVPESENLILNCGKTRNTVPIEGSGFLHVNEFCSVRASNFVLISLVEYTKPVESNYSPPFNLTKFLDLSELDEFEMKISRYEQMILPFDFEKLSKISYVFEGSKQKLASLYYILLVPIIILVFVISYLVYKKKIDARNILNSNKIFSRNREQPPDNSLNEPDHEKLQIRVKLNKKNDEIKKISVHEDQSTTDPDSEYLTVRFKVKKRQKY
ncbi:hypothetical protein NQ314_002603 [Rhamnusium bicolor]|uniref:Envelope fusion protein n=1 Tax=Rhamnusium bicolor TaxID=1586634 RepID=A0AAV8ZR19_9CUCU|nr:hypothetical protein NQ314_002603 [Rhamnusium bicolor]